MAMSSAFRLRGKNPNRGNGPLDDSTHSHMFNDSLRNILVLVTGEFCGTFMFLLLSFIGAQTALDTNSPNPSADLRPFSLMYIAASFGCALAVNVWIFYRVTGGMFNPAVTIGLLLVGAVTPLRAICIIVTQFVAAIAAAAVVDGLLPGPLTVANALGNGTNTAQGLFLEMFMTAQLVLTVYFLAVEKHRATYLAPIGIGLSVFIAHICNTNWTGTGINPARSFGPACIEGFVGYHWIYWLGPVMGSFLAWGVYSLMRWLEYHTANPGQDNDSTNDTSPVTTKMPTSDTVLETDGNKPRPGTARNDSVMEGQVPDPSLQV